MVEEDVVGEVDEEAGCVVGAFEDVRFVAAAVRGALEPTLEAHAPEGVREGLDELAGSVELLSVLCTLTGITVLVPMLVLTFCGAVACR